MTVHKLSVKELHERLQAGEQTWMLDVRAAEKYNEFHIENPLVENCNIPKTVIFTLDEQGEEGGLSLPKDKEIIITCTTGNSAAKCADILDRLKYKVKVLEGGVTAWKQYTETLKD